MNDDDANYTHLNEVAKKALSLSVAERIQHVRSLKKVWIPYDLAKVVLEKASELLASEKAPRLPCLLLWGDPNPGKTATLKHYYEQHPILPNPGGETIIAPVIPIELKGPDIGEFYSSILRAIKEEFRPEDRIAKKRHQVLTVLAQIGTRQLLIDELGTAIAGPDAAQRKFMVELKNVLNELEMTAFATGTQNAKSALAVDEQLESRFEMLELVRWRNNTNFRRLLESFERHIPLQYPSVLQKPTLAEKLHVLTEGLLGELAELLMKAAVLAIKSNHENIDSEILEKLNWKPPSIRRAAAREAIPG